MKRTYPRTAAEAKGTPAPFPHAPAGSISVPLYQINAINRVRFLISSLYWDGYARSDQDVRKKVEMKARVTGELMQLRSWAKEISRRAKADSKATIRKRGDEPL